MEDRSALFNQLKEFSQRKLKKVETKVVTGTGEQLVEKRGAKGLQVLGGDGSGGANGAQQQPARKLDLQVGFILPGLLIGSQDVAHDKSSLDSYGITHILNLDRDVENKFEDEYNYKNVAMQDSSDFVLESIFDDCFDFIDDGRHYGNVLVHCSGTIGLSRSTSLCVAYVMSKEKQSFSDAFNNVKEARSFVKPNESFLRQLKEYESKLRGAQQVKESGIDDPFALRKKQEIEQEKAMVAGAASVKNRMKLFGAQLDAPDQARSKSVSPAPFARQQQQQERAPSKWSERQEAPVKSATPEPRKSWQASSKPPAPPPPAPAMPVANKSTGLPPAPPPPPPPPPPPGESHKQQATGRASSQAGPSSKSKQAANQTYSSSDRKASISAGDTGEPAAKTVFGKRPPPLMKIRGGLSIERQDSVSSDKASSTRSAQKSSLQLPLKKQFTSDSDGESATAAKERAPSPSAALRAAKRESGASSPTTTNETGANSKLGLNRSSTKKLLNLIKTKTRTDLTLPDGDENDEIEALLGALESESIDNIDWDELGLDEDEVKDIIQKGGASSSSSSSSSSSDDEEDDEDEEEVEEVETSTKHYVIRSK